MKTYKLSVVEVYIVGIGVFDANHLTRPSRSCLGTGYNYSVSDKVLDWLANHWLKTSDGRYYCSSDSVLFFLQRLSRKHGSKHATYPDNGVIDLLIDGSLVGWLRVV